METSLPNITVYLFIVLEFELKNSILIGLHSKVVWIGIRKCKFRH